MDISSSHTVEGSPKYMAPEIQNAYNLRSRRTNYRAKVDAWSFGAVILECYVGYQGKLSDYISMTKTSAEPILKEVVSHLLVHDTEKRKLLHSDTIRQAVDTLF